VSKAGYATKTGSVTVTNNDENEDVSLVPLPPDYYNVVFVVTDEAGNSITGATIIFDGEPLTGYSTAAQNGVYQYSVSKEGYITKSGNVTVQDNDVTEPVTLEIQYYTVTFAVKDAETDQTINDADIQFDGESVTGNSVQTTIGEHPWSVSKTGYVSQSGTVTVTNADKEVPVSLEKQYYTVTFAVKDAESDEPITDADIQFDGSTITGNSVQAQIGEHSWSVSKEGYVPQTGTVTVTNADKEVPVSLEKEPPVTYTVTFVVKDKQGIDIDGAQIEFDGKPVSSYIIPDVANGTYHFKVSKMDYDTVEDDVTVEDADETVNITMETVSILTNTLSEATLHPNPFTNEIRINASVPIKSVQITNAIGQKVKEVIFNGKSISTSDLANGAYFVTIESFNGEKAVHKMIKK
jgi:hypothetical protein